MLGVERAGRAVHNVVLRTGPALLRRIKSYSTRLREKITQGGFIRNVLMMMVGTAIGQLGAVLASPILTRLYTPEEFGILGAFTAALGIITVIATLRYEMALPLVRDDKDATNLLLLCAIALFGMTALLIVGLLIFTPHHFTWASLGILEPFRWLLPIGFFCVGAYQLMVYLATRQHDFKAIAQTKIYQGGVGPLTQIGMGIGQFGSIGLILGFIIGQSMGISQLVWRLVIKKHRQLRDATWDGIKLMARRYIRFPLVSSWSALINVLGSQVLLAVAMPILYSSTVAGYIYLTDRVIVRPLIMVSTSILQVYVGEASKNLMTDPGAVRRRFLQLTMTQIGIVSVWILLMNLAAPYIFPIAFGAEWAAAVPYLCVLSIALLPQLVAHALIHTLQMLERQGLSAAWETGRLLVVGGALIISAKLGFSALHALLAYSICQAGAQIVLLLLMYRSIQKLQPPVQKGILDA